MYLDCLPVNHNVYVLRSDGWFCLCKFVHDVFIAFWFECRSLLHHRGRIPLSFLGRSKFMMGDHNSKYHTHLSQSKVEQELPMLRVLYQKSEAGDSGPLRRIVGFLFIADTVLEDLFMRKEEGTSDYCRYSNIDLALIVCWEVDGGHRWVTAATSDHDRLRLPLSGKIGLVQTLPTSRDVNSHTAAILREKSVTLAYIIGYMTLNKKWPPGIAIQTRPPPLPGSRFRTACLTRDIRTFSMMTKLSTLSEHTGYVQ
jgi:hypothetical protein